jgi:hypothetical protein
MSGIRKCRGTSQAKIGNLAENETGLPEYKSVSSSRTHVERHKVDFLHPAQAMEKEEIDFEHQPSLSSK